MKRIIRLTESDLTRIVRRVIMEEETDQNVQALKNAVSTFNTTIEGIMGKSPEFSVLSPYYGTDNNEYTSISYPTLINGFGAIKPYGIIGVNNTKKEYKTNNDNGPATNADGRGKFIVPSIVLKTYYSTGGNSEGWSKFTVSKKYQPSLDAAKTLFDTIDPIFKQMIAGQQPEA